MFHEGIVEPFLAQTEGNIYSPKSQKYIINFLTTEEKTMVKIRLKRIGKKKAPFYRIIVSDAARTTQSTSLAEIGTYDPLKDPAEIHINEEEARKWLSYGAQPTETVAKLLKIAGVTK